MRCAVVAEEHFTLIGGGTEDEVCSCQCDWPYGGTSCGQCRDPLFVYVRLPPLPALVSSGACGPGGLVGRLVF